MFVFVLTHKASVFCMKSKHQCCFFCGIQGNNVLRFGLRFASQSAKGVYCFDFDSLSLNKIPCVLQLGSEKEGRDTAL